jgi:hypothetical protein
MTDDANKISELMSLQSLIRRIQDALNDSEVHSSLRELAAWIAVRSQGPERRQAISQLLGHMHTYYSGFEGMDSGEVTRIHARAFHALELEADLGTLIDVTDALPLAEDVAIALLARARESENAPRPRPAPDAPSEQIKRMQFTEACTDLKYGTFAVLKDCDLLRNLGPNPELAGTIVAGFALFRRASKAA